MVEKRIVDAVIENVVRHIPNEIAPKIHADRGVLETTVRVYGCYDEIISTIDRLVAAETPEEKLKAVRSAYLLKTKLNSPR